MRRGLLRRLHDRRLIGFRLKAGDILRNRAIEKLHPLGQIADMAPEHFGIILIERRAIEADLAARRAPEAGDRIGKGRFARPRGPDHAKRLPRLQAKAHHP